MSAPLETAQAAAPAPAATAAAPSPRRSAPALQLADGIRAIVPYARYATERIGRLGVVGVALLAFGALWALSANAPLRTEIATGSATLQDLASAGNGGAATAAPSAPQARLETFLHDLPTPNDLPSIMARVVGASAATGVQLEEGRYELAAGKAGRIARYRMTFPVTGQYPQIRAFIEQALVAVPAMSLDGLRLERHAIADAAVTAELDFAVLVRAQP